MGNLCVEMISLWESDGNNTKLLGNTESNQHNQYWYGDVDRYSTCMEALEGVND